MDKLLCIKDDRGLAVWDISRFTDFIKQGAPAPETVNPSLWRQSQLTLLAGLYQVTHRERGVLLPLPYTREGWSSYEELGELGMSYPSSITSTAFIPVQADVSSAHPTSEG